MDSLPSVHLPGEKLGSGDIANTPSTDGQKVWYKTFLAQALGVAAIRGGHTVLFTRLDAIFKDLAQARVDHSLERAFRRYLTPDILIVDDFGLHCLSAMQSNDLYELIIERHRRSSFVITSNRSVDEWLGLFDDPILGNSALDRLCYGAYQIVIEGPSYRAKKAPKVLDQN